MSDCRAERARARSEAFALLARAFVFPDPEFESELARGVFPHRLRDALERAGACGPLEDRAEGLARAAIGAPKDLRDLRHEHARLFARVGPRAVSLFETDFGAPEIEARARELADLDAFYAKVEPASEARPEERPDSVVRELGFFALLASEQARALDEGEGERVERLERVEGEFLVAHLGRWVEALEEEIAAREGASAFYAALGRLAAAFVAWDASRLGVEPKPLRPSPGFRSLCG